LDGKKTFYDVPEAICGATAEWVLAECKRQEEPPYVDIHKAIAEAAKQQAACGGIIPTLPWVQTS
jgi:hypothetical protein